MTIEHGHYWQEDFDKGIISCSICGIHRIFYDLAELTKRVDELENRVTDMDTIICRNATHSHGYVPPPVYGGR